MMQNEVVTLRHLGSREYSSTWEQLKSFTNNRSKDTIDEIWCLEHLPVFTQGQAGRPENVICPGEIPVLKSDRGGQVTYHGPGQLIVYFLVDIARKKISLRSFIDILENSVVELLANFGLKAYTDKTAPGVYVDNAKICSLGLRVRKGCTYHGLSLNISMDLEPFQRINPCGYAGMQVTKLENYIPDVDMATITNDLVHILQRKIGYI